MNFYKYIRAQFVKGEKQFFKNFLGGHIMAKIIKKSHRKSDAFLFLAVAVKSLLL